MSNVQPAEIAKKCPNCEAAIRENALFCHKCGFSYQVLHETNENASASEKDDEQITSEWFMPTQETNELNEKNLQSGDSFAKPDADKDKFAQIPALNPTPSALLIREHREWKLPIPPEKDLSVAEISLPENENTNTDATTEIKMESAEIKRRIAELDKQNDEPEIIDEPENSFAPIAAELEKPTAPAEEEMNDIQSFKTKTTKIKEIMPENVADIKVADVKVENVIEETAASESAAPLIERKDSFPVKSTSRTAAPPRRQIAKTKEYVWEESPDNSTLWFFLTAFLALAVALTLFWFSGFFKL